MDTYEREIRVVTDACMSVPKKSKPIPPKKVDLTPTIQDIFSKISFSNSYSSDIKI